MAEFRSSARSTGFNAINVPDNARRVQQAGEKRVNDLRRVYEQTIEQKKQYAQDQQASFEAVDRQILSNQRLESDFRKQYKQALRSRQNQAIEKLKKEQELKQDAYERLGTFSKGAMELGKELYEHHKEERQAYGLALVMETGVTAQELEDLQNAEFDLEVEGAANNNTYQRLRASGAGALELKKLRDLDGWALYGAQKALAQQAKQNWFAFSNNPQNRNKKYRVGDQELSLADAELAGMSSERANILGQMKAEFFKPYADYDLAFAEKYMFPGMREVDTINETNYTTQLSKDLEQQERSTRYQEIGNVINSKDPTGLQRIINMRAPDGGPLRKAVREQLLDDLDKMADAKMLTRQDLAVLKNQILRVNGKEVTFSKQFLEGNARFSDTAIAFAGIEEKIRLSEVAKDDLKQRETRQQISAYTDQVFAQYAASGSKPISNLEASKIEADFKAKFEGKALPDRLKSLLTFQNLGIESQRQVQTATQAAMDGSLQSLQQLTTQYPDLNPKQVREISRIAGIDMEKGVVVSSEIKDGLKTIKKFLSEKIGTADKITGAATLDQFMPYVEEKYINEILYRSAKDPGRSLEDISREVVADYSSEITDQKEGSFFQIAGVGRSTRFVQLDNKSNESRKIEEIDELIGGDYERLLSTERLLGKDPNQDPDSLVGQLPLIGQTGRAPDWLLRLSQESGIPWKQIFNSQAAAYGLEDRLTPNRVEAVQEIVRPEFRTFLGDSPSAGTVQQASTQYQRQNGVTGLDVYRPILNLIASQESSNDTVHGGYDAMNLGGTNGGHTAIGSNTGEKYFQRPLMDFTLGEIRDLQRQGKLHAAGRYQFLGPTIDDTFQRGSLPPDVTMDSKFDQNTQDLLAIAYFRLTMQDYAGTDGSVIRGLGQRWIGLQNLEYDEKLRIVKKIQNDPRYQNPGFQAYEVSPEYEAARQSKYGG